ncbi:cytochrome P450 1A1-like [Rhopilema esculentum]|uniref:cytochrome P450 1A1-like n=1 Tax=Rhopilema esculentum TaxID=499914 RepID=UPI0031CDBDF0
MVIETVIVASLVLCALLYANIFIRPKSFPPGPIPLPVIGSIHLIGSEPQKSLKALAKRYGHVFSVYFGGWPVVVISSIEAAKESLIQKSTDFAGRPVSYTGIEAAKGHKTGRGIDIVYSDYGPYWQAIRKLAHKALKMYGANRVQLEKTINTHIDELIERFAKIDSQCLDPKRNFGKLLSVKYFKTLCDRGVAVWSDIRSLIKISSVFSRLFRFGTASSCINNGSDGPGVNGKPNCAHLSSVPDGFSLIQTLPKIKGIRIAWLEANRTGPKFSCQSSIGIVRRAPECKCMARPGMNPSMLCATVIIEFCTMLNKILTVALFFIALISTNVICQIVSGSKYNIDNEEFMAIMHSNKLLFEGIVGTSGVDFLTWLRHFPNHNARLIKESESLRDPILAKWLKKHRETFEKGNIRDFTDALLDAADEEIKQNKSSDRYLKEENILMIMADVFSAGIETTATTMNWFVAFSVLWPETQKKIHEELDRVIGRTRKPCMDDRPALNYLEAAINETLRFASVTPIAVPHCTKCDTSVAGYKIPKGTHVFYNLYAMHHDERHWVGPEDFRPERWLDEEGKYIPGAKPSFLPFSAGKRVCFGEALAKMELFLILAKVYQRFEFLPGNNEDLPKVDGFVFVTHEPKPYKIQVRKRL